MTGIYLILPTLIVVIMSFLVVSAGTVALMMTGLDSKRASFQALSAFTRAGFTTRESEVVINNPRRRSIVTWLIVIGNAGFVTVIVTATSSVATSEGYVLYIAIAALLVGAYLMYRLARYAPIARWWERFVHSRLIKSPIFEETTTEDLLHLIEGYGVVRVTVPEDSPFVGRTLRQIFRPDDQLWVVGIERGSDWISLPRSREVVNSGDRLVTYGDLATLRNLAKPASTSAP
jgi:hypothetical protein